MLCISRLIVKCTAIALSSKIGPTGSRRAGEMMVLVCVFFWCCVLCDVCCAHSYLLYGTIYDTLPLVCGPVNSQIFTKDSVLKKPTLRIHLLQLVFRWTLSCASYFSSKNLVYKWRNRHSFGALDIAMEKGYWGAIGMVQWKHLQCLVTLQVCLVTIHDVQ